MAKVYIGVGHGGSDPGAVKYLVEKDIDLQMAKGCSDYLKEHNVDVLISRTGDIDSSINEKTTMCNHWGADLALDIHNNAGGGEGFEVWHSVNGCKGKVLAQNIEKEVLKIGQKSRGLKTKKNAYGSDYFGFIRQTKCPAIICEGVFVDNKADAAKADTEEKCRAFGVAYAKGILATLGMNTEQSANGETKTPEQAVVQPEQTNKNGSTNMTKNPLLVSWGDMNTSALAYWRDLGLTPAGLKKIDESAIKTKKTSALGDILRDIGS